MDPLKPVVPGQPLSIGAATWNALLAEARAGRAERAAAGSTRPARLPMTPNLTCLVKYDAASVTTLPVHSVVTLASLIPDLSGTDGDPHGVNRRPAYVAGTPTGPGDAVVVTLEPIQGGSLGRAVLAGHVVATVDVSDEEHTRAVPIDGDSDKFNSASGGGYPIVFKESGTGEVKAVVDLGPLPSGGEYSESFGLFGVSHATGGGSSGVWRDQSYHELTTPGSHLVLFQQYLRYVVVPSGCYLRIRLRVVMREYTAPGVYTETVVANSERNLFERLFALPSGTYTPDYSGGGFNSTVALIATHAGGAVITTQYRVQILHEITGSGVQYSAEGVGPMLSLQVGGPFAAGLTGGVTGTFGG